MERPPKQPRREEFPSEEHGAHDLVMRRFRATYGGAGEDPNAFFDIGAYFGSLLNSPPMCALAAQLGAFFRNVGNEGNSFSHADREFVDQVLANEFKSNVVQIIHIVDAAKAGVRIEAIEALRHGRIEDLNEDEKLLDRYIRQVVRGTVDRETYDRMGDRLGKRGLVEYTGFIMWLTWIMRMMQALDTGTISEERVDELIAEARTIQADPNWAGAIGGWHPKTTATDR